MPGPAPGPAARAAALALLLLPSPGAAAAGAEPENGWQWGPFITAVAVSFAVVVVLISLYLCVCRWIARRRRRTQEAPELLAKPQASVLPPSPPPSAGALHKPSGAQNSEPGLHRLNEVHADQLRAEAAAAAVPAPICWRIRVPEQGLPLGCSFARHRDGLVVAGVEPTGEAARRGLRSGDVVLAIGSQLARELDEAETTAALAQRPLELGLRLQLAPTALWAASGRNPKESWQTQELEDVVVLDLEEPDSAAARGQAGPGGAREALPRRASAPEPRRPRGPRRSEPPASEMPSKEAVREEAAVPEQPRAAWIGRQVGSPTTNSSALMPPVPPQGKVIIQHVRLPHIGGDSIGVTELKRHAPVRKLGEKASAPATLVVPITCDG